MTHSEKRIYLIKELLSEQPQYRDMEIPDNAEEQKRLLRSLMNIRSPLQYKGFQCIMKPRNSFCNLEFD